MCESMPNVKKKTRNFFTMKLKLLLALTVIFTASGAAISFSSGTGKAAMVTLSGTIQPSASGSLYSGGGMTPENIREINNRIQNGNYEAVVYEINSGGGTVVASKEIMRDIEKMEVPTVCRFRDLAASGAYMISLGCDKIVADPASMTGSIGVKSSYLEFSGALDEFGVEYVNITAGKNKDVGSPYRNATPEQKEILQEKAEKVHQQFLDLVRENRNISEGNFSDVRTGTIFLGTEAEEIGLVDSLGGREEAFNTAENLAGKNLSFSGVQREQSLGLLSLLSADIFLGNFLGANQAPLKASFY